MLAATPIPMMSSPIETYRGKFQSPLASTISPKIGGETTAASAEPIFMKPLALPEYAGAISPGIAQKAPIDNSKKKNAAVNPTVTLVRSLRQIHASRHRMAPLNDSQINPTRATLRLLRLSSQSVKIPPIPSPTTPARNTAAAKLLDLLRSRP